MDLFDGDSISKQDGCDGQVTVAFDGNVAVIHMKCGQNRFNVSFIKKLEDALDVVERNKKIKLLITTAEGKFYSNGLDLEWMLSLSEPQQYYFEKKLCAVVWKIITFPVPTVAAVNGHAFAMGAILALIHDYAIMSSDKGWWCLNEVNINRMFPDYFKAVLRSRLSTGPTFHQSVVLGNRYTGQQAVEQGIMSEICPQRELITRAKVLGQTLMRRGTYSRDSLRRMKEDIFQEVKIEMTKLYERNRVSKL